MNIHNIYTPNQVSKVLGNLSKITIPFWTVWKEMHIQKRFEPNVQQSYLQIYFRHRSVKFQCQTGHLPLQKKVWWPLLGLHTEFHTIGPKLLWNHICFVHIHPQSICTQLTSQSAPTILVLKNIGWFSTLKKIGYKI